MHVRARTPHTQPRLIVAAHHDYQPAAVIGTPPTLSTPAASARHPPQQGPQRRRCCSTAQPMLRMCALLQACAASLRMWMRMHCAARLHFLASLHQHMLQPLGTACRLFQRRAGTHVAGRCWRANPASCCRRLRGRRLGSTPALATAQRTQHAALRHQRCLPMAAHARAARTHPRPLPAPQAS